MNPDAERPFKPVGPVRTRRFQSYALLTILVVILVVLGSFVYDRFTGWDLKDHVVTYFGKDDVSRKHYAGPVLYEQIPPVGGLHNGVPQTCGFYDQYIENAHAVHSLEHGAVWITYDPSLPTDRVEKLRQIATQPYVLVSPYPGLDAPVIISAWGHQLTLDDVDTGKNDAFMREYKNSTEYTPEFGAACAGGTNATTDEVPQKQPFVQANASAAPIGGIRDIDATATAAAISGEPVATPVGGSPPSAG